MGALRDTIEIGSHRVFSEMPLPQPRREKVDVFGRVTADALQYVDKILVGFDIL